MTQARHESGTDAAHPHLPKAASLSTAIVDMLKEEPDRIFTVKDFIDKTHANEATVRKTLSRLSSSRKGGGPVKRIAHGLYQYDPTGEDAGLMAIMKYGHWRVENISFDSLGAQGECMPHSSEDEFSPISGTKSSIPQPRPGFPWILPTKQQVQWEVYQNGTEVIRLSANRAAPFSPDHVLTLMQFLETEGFGDDKWVCKSIEANVEGRKLRIDGSFSIQLIEGLLLKVYQHGPALRIELADRRPHSLPEVISFLKAICDGFDGAEALKIAQDFDARLTRCEKKTSKALTAVRDACNRERFCNNITGSKGKTSQKGPDILKNGSP
jgi:hypothetical protein